jgi:hypothetical protein
VNQCAQFWRYCCFCARLQTYPQVITPLLQAVSRSNKEKRLWDGIILLPIQTSADQPGRASTPAATAPNNYLPFGSAGLQAVLC